MAIGTNPNYCPGTCDLRAQMAFELASQTAKPNSQDMADLAKRFAFVRDADAKDKHKEAEITLEHALALYEAAFGQEHPSVAEIMFALSDVYRAHGKQTSADYMRRWADEILHRPKDEPTHEFFHLFGMDAAEEQATDI